MERKLNVCIVSREFPPDTAFGGIGTFSVDTALMLKQHGHRVTVLSQSLSRTHSFDYQGVTVWKLKVPRPCDTYHFLPALILGFNYVILRTLRRLHAQTPFDLVDAPDHLAEGLSAALFTDLPVVTRLHTPFALLVDMGLNDYRKGPAYAFIRLAEKIAIARSTAVYAPCLDLVRRCQTLFSLPQIPVKVFGYPLDLDLFAPHAPSPGDGSVRLLFLGRFEQRKGIETIVGALPQIVARRPDAKLTMVGRDTPNMPGYSSGREYIERSLERAGCLANVEFRDYVPLEGLPRIFHEHDIVWVPSLYDNYPIVCLEAMACGKPVVVADSGGLPEMVKDGVTGLVFETGNADALAARTLELCESPELSRRLARAAREDTLTQCSPESIYGHTMELYRYALERAAADRQSRAAVANHS
jgi:glycosyltransferase involved in cell wall biosynthesis